MVLSASQLRRIVESTLSEGGSTTLDIEAKVEELVDVVMVWLEQFDVDPDVVGSVLLKFDRGVRAAIYAAHDDVAALTTKRGLA